MIFSYLLNMQSHPSWVCGLKLFARLNKSTFAASHPSWVCGLKHLYSDNYNNKTWGHTLRGCVD